MIRNSSRDSVLRQKLIAAATMLVWAFWGLTAPGQAAGKPMDPKGKTGIYDVVLIAPDTSGRDPVPAGSPATIFVLMTNAGTAPLKVPSMIRLVLNGEDDRSVSVAASLQGGGRGAVPPGGFARLVYGFNMPLQLAGLVKAREISMKTNTVMFYAGPAAVADTKGLAQKTPDPEPVTAMLPKFQPFFVNFYPYKPVYFLFGADPGVQKTSFQVSFKYKLFNFAKIKPGNGVKNRPGQNLSGLYPAVFLGFEIRLRPL